MDLVFPSQTTYKIAVLKGEHVQVAIDFQLKCVGCEGVGFYVSKNGAAISTSSAGKYSFELTSDATIKVWVTESWAYQATHYGEATYTIRATFPPRYKVSCRTGSGDVTGEEIEEKHPEGDLATLPGEIFYRTGYRQRGWTESDLGATKAYALGERVADSRDYTLYPYWEKASTYAIRYLPDSRSAGSARSDTKTQGLPITLLKKSPFTREGCVQAGWSLTENGEQKYLLGDQYTADADLTLYPYWINATEQLTFSPGRLGVGGVLVETKTAGSAYRLYGAIYSRLGYLQSGWTAEDGGEKQYELFGDYMGQKAATFYPVWTPDPAADKLYMVIDISSGSASETYPVSYLADVPKGGWTEEYKTTKIVLRRIASKKNSSYEVPEVAKPYYVGVFEVTQKQYRQVVGSLPTTGEGPFGDLIPVNNVTMRDIHSRYFTSGAFGRTDSFRSYSAVPEDGFFDRLRRRTGNSKIDLPTLDQWQYACRAGASYVQRIGLDREASTFVTDIGRLMLCYESNPEDVWSVAVGSYLPNAWGLYDMLGNETELGLNCVSSQYAIHGGNGKTHESQMSWRQVFYWDPTIYRSGFRLFCETEEIVAPVLTTYRVEFESNGGSSVGAQEVTQGGCATRPANPTRSGYTFAGWYSDSGLTAVYDFSTAVTASRTLYAKWTAVPAPATPRNDDFSQAKELVGATGSVTVDSTGATTEGGEPLLAFSSMATGTVWFRWTAPSDGRATFDTADSEVIDTVMGVYTGVSLSTLAAVDENDDDEEIGFASRCEFDCTSGTRYYIAVAGYDGDEGTVNLHWSFVANREPYYIRFSNLAGGSMPNIECRRDCVCQLPPCTAKPPAGKRFAGWRCSNGKRYDDGMLVFNLANPGETVTMTAIWE